MQEKRLNTSSLYQFRRSVSPVTRKLLKNTKRILLNRSFIKDLSKRWKKRNKLKNLNEKIRRNVKRKGLHWS